MMKKTTTFSPQAVKPFIGLLILILGLITLSAQTASAFEEDFELGQGEWTIDNGVWEVGTPTAGPGSCYSGDQCAGTVLNGNYPFNTDSRLSSATMQLPVLSGSEELHLRFQNWFSYSSYDSGQVQISVWDSGAATWGAWQNIGTVMVDWSGWSLKDIELSSYAGQRVRLGFYHTAASPNESTGWYIDDIEIVAKVPEFTGDFETGWADWGTNRGVWEIGTPTSGPGSCYSGSRCAGTMLNGNILSIPTVV